MALPFHFSSLTNCYIDLVSLKANLLCVIAFHELIDQGSPQLLFIVLNNLWPFTSRVCVLLSIYANRLILFLTVSSYFARLLQDLWMSNFTRILLSCVLEFSAVCFWLPGSLWFLFYWNPFICPHILPVAFSTLVGRTKLPRRFKPPRFSQETVQHSFTYKRVAIG